MYVLYALRFFFQSIETKKLPINLVSVNNLKDAISYVRIVEFGGIAEPLLYPNFDAFIALLNKSNVDVLVVTNGSLLKMKLRALKNIDYIISY